MAKRITLTEATSTSPEPTRIIASRVQARAVANHNHEDTFEAVVAFARYLVARRRSIIALVIIGLTLAGAWLAMTPNQYRSYATILPTGSQSGLAELKTLAGIPVTEEDPSALYPVILTSQWMLNRVMQEPITYRHNGEPHQVTMQEYFGIENPDLLRSSLAGITLVSADKRSGVIQVAVETNYPGLSQAIVQRYIDNLEDFNTNHRASQARNNAKYLERQLVEREATLHAAEDRMEQIQKANRAWMLSTDPELAKTIARMKLEIETQTQAYMYLRQQYEMAQFDAQKDMPIVRVLDRPTRPTVKSAPVRSLVMIFALFASFGIGVVYHLAGYALNRRKEQAGADSLGLLIQDIRGALPWTGRRPESSVAAQVKET